MHCFLIEQHAGYMTGEYDTESDANRF